jgi:hypothetical protein
MKNPKITLILITFLLPFSAFAHGEEVLVPIFIQFGLILTFLILITFIMIRVVEKLILSVVYFLAVGLMLYIFWNLPYRQNHTAIDLSISLGPALLTLITYIFLKPRPGQTK